MSGIVPSVGIEWFVDDQSNAQSHENTDAASGITCANDDLFLQTKNNTARVEPGAPTIQELIQKGMAYDRIALKVRNSTKQLLSSDASKLRSNLVSVPDPSVFTKAPKWLRNT